MSTLPDASHGVDALSRAPPQQAQGKVYPSMYPLPGSSHPPLSSPPNVTFPAFTSFVPGVYNAGGVNYFPNYQGLSTTYLPTGFIPPTQNSAPPTNVVNFQAPCYPFYDMPVGTATSTTTLLSSEDTGRHEQSAQFTFQCPLPAQPDAAPAQQQWQGQHHQQVAQENSTVEKPPLGPREVDTEDHQTREESHEALAELEVRLYSATIRSTTMLILQQRMRWSTVVLTTRRPHALATGRFVSTFCARSFGITHTRFPPSRLHT